jgi:hypothetical protein
MVEARPGVSVRKTAGRTGLCLLAVVGLVGLVVDLDMVLYSRVAVKLLRSLTFDTLVLL